GVLLLGCGEQHAEAPAAARRAFARLQLGLGRPLVELLLVHRADRLRLAVDAAVNLQRLVHAHRRLAVRGDLDLAFDQADDLVALPRAAPEVGAANAGGDLRRAHRDFAAAIFCRQLGGETKRAFEHIERRLEELARRAELGKAQLPLLAELDEAAFGEAYQDAPVGAADDLIAGAQLHSRHDRLAHAVALDPGRHLHAVDGRRDLREARARWREQRESEHRSP